MLNVLQKSAFDPMELEESKGCNDCHKDKNPKGKKVGDVVFAAPIDPFGLSRLTRGVSGHQYVIDVSANVPTKPVNHRNLPATPKIAETAHRS